MSNPIAINYASPQSSKWDRSHRAAGWSSLALIIFQFPYFVPAMGLAWLLITGDSDHHTLRQNVELGVLIGWPTVVAVLLAVYSLSDAQRGKYRFAAMASIVVGICIALLLIFAR